MKESGFRYLTVIVGLLAALAIIFSQSLSHNVNGKSNLEMAQSANSSDDAEPTTHYIPSISTTAFPASAQINFFQDAFCLFEITFDSESDTPEPNEIGVPLNKFFNTILRVIISPNAP